MSDQIIEKVVEQLETLPSSLQQQVLAFVEALKLHTLQGVPGHQLLEFAGSISEDDLQRMRQAIEEDCEQVDLDEW